MALIDIFKTDPDQFEIDSVEEHAHHWRKTVFSSLLVSYKAPQKNHTTTKETYRLLIPAVYTAICDEVSNS